MAVGTTRGKRRLGRFVRTIVDRSGMTPTEIGEEAVCAKQTITRLLAGTSLPRRHLFMIVLQVIGATDEERKRALALWEVADANSSLIEHASDLPPSYMRFRLDEREAILERTLDTVVVPGLLQTARYAFAKAEASQALMRGTWEPETEAAERHDRQGVLGRETDPLRLHALVDQAALCRVFGGPEVMVEQLDHLVAMAKLDHVTVQVIPFEVGAYGAMSGPLMLLSFPEPDDPDSAYVESLIGLHTVEDEENVEALAAVWGGAAERALSPQKSVQLIKKIRGQFDG